MSVCPFVHLSICLSVRPSVYQPLCLFLYISISISLSCCLSHTLTIRSLSLYNLYIYITLSLSPPLSLFPSPPSLPPLSLYLSLRGTEAQGRRLRSWEFRKSSEFGCFGTPASSSQRESHENTCYSATRNERKIVTDLC